MHKDFEARYSLAVKAAKLSDVSEPRATSARIDRKSGRLIVELKNGSAFMVPIQLLEGLASAEAKDLASVGLTPSGDGLHWETLDIDLSLSGLIAGVFGGKRWMSELGKLGGKVRSAAKAEASRSNGLKGGRPKQKSA